MLEVSAKFCELLRKGDEEAAFALLTPENVNWRIKEEHFDISTVLTEFLACKDIPDNPRVIDHVFKLGFRFNDDEDDDDEDDIGYGIKNAICSGKIKTARALSFYYPCTLNDFAYSHCRREYPHYVPTIIIIDLGYRTNYHKCIFLRHLESVRMLAIITMGAISRSPPPLRGGGGGAKDIARIIGRVIWESRALNFKI